MLRPLPAISPCPTSADGRKVSLRRLKTDTGPLYPKSCPDHRFPLPLTAHSAAVTSSLRWIRAKIVANYGYVLVTEEDDRVVGILSYTEVIKELAQ